MSSGESAEIRIANEYAEVLVHKVMTRNGARLRIRDVRSEREVLLCPLELEALTWQTPEAFSVMLSTPFGPEDGAG